MFLHRNPSVYRYTLGFRYDVQVTLSSQYLDVIKTKTLNPVPPAQQAAQDLGMYG
ncbi:MAG: hypothetical protein AAGA75_07325 [Cyanobacteria bacterium P01_E01_bin.6]